MPDTETKPNTESEKQGYDLLIDKIKEMNDTIEKQNKKIEDVVAMNRALLDGNVEKSPSTDKVSEHDKLEEKLLKGLRL